MKKEPLFIRFANNESNVADVVRSFIDLSEDKPSKGIAERTLKEIPDLTLFRRDFSNALEDLIDNGISRNLVNYTDSYMKPSLLEITDNNGGSRTNERRWVTIKAEGSPWIEALVCYNLAIYLKAFGIKDLKKCPICGKFFSNKGKYAKYCSEHCRAVGGGK